MCCNLFNFSTFYFLLIIWIHYLSNTLQLKNTFEIWSSLNICFSLMVPFDLISTGPYLDSVKLPYMFYKLEQLGIEQQWVWSSEFVHQVFSKLLLSPEGIPMIVPRNRNPKKCPCGQLCNWYGRWYKCFGLFHPDYDPHHCCKDTDILKWQ